MASDNTVSFPGLLADAAMQIETAGFSTVLWTPQFGWLPEDEEASEDPHPPQLLAAYQIFILFFVIRDRKKAWVHLGAEMQAGKTGVLAGLIRLILSNFRKLQIHPSNIFVITGMSDTAWKKQTKERLIPDVRDGVEHNARGGLDRIAEEMYRMHGRSGELRNILIIVDESHIAAADSNRPQRMVFDTLGRLCPRDKWVENNIHVLTISATDPAKVMDITTAAEADSAVVRLQTTPDYQSVESLLADERIIPIQGDIHTEWATDAIRDIIFHEYDNQPLYHLLRPKATNYQKTVNALAREFPDATIICWDGSNKGGAAGGSGSSTTSDADINDILEEAPARTTFILLKNMLYAAKTLEDEHVGILFDRVGGKDDTNLQSLLGRACGYFKSKRTYVFTSKQTVDNYISCWKELCSKKGFPSAVKDIPKSRLNKKMSRVVARTYRGDTSLYTDGRTPLAGGAAAGGAGTPPPARATADESLFDSEWREFDTFEEARAWAPRIHEKQQDDYGFYLSSTTGAATVLTYDVVMGMKAGKKTANMPWKTLAPGGRVDRLYVAYTDIEDPNSAVFIVRRLTRKA
jgi:hypothetical protein